MNILSLLFLNLSRSPVSLDTAQRVAAPHGLRGLLQNDITRCVGCGSCAYACSSGALCVTERDAHADWDYSPAKCTFCGRCMEVCPLDALTLQAEPPPTYSHPTTLDLHFRVEYPSCPNCGQPTRPILPALLLRAYPSAQAEDTHYLSYRLSLCPACRQTESARHQI